jgi:hypothetical protein
MVITCNKKFFLQLFFQNSNFIFFSKIRNFKVCGFVNLLIEKKAYCLQILMQMNEGW